MKRNLYLNIKEKEAARQEYLDVFAEVRPSAEKIAVSESLGRTTAEAVYAVCSSPAYNSCAMDGIAVISSHTKGASEDHPLTLEAGKDYVEADTGDMLTILNGLDYFAEIGYMAYKNNQTQQSDYD